MNFLGQNSHESSTNTSLTATNLLPQTPVPITAQEVHNPPRHRPLPPIPNYEPHVVPKSYYSSINNILPCNEGENSGFRSKRDEDGSKAADGTPFSSITFQENSSKSLEISASAQKTSLENSLEKPPARNVTRPPLKPVDVSKGISALHQKVDELLKKTSQARAASPKRSVSIDSRVQNNSSQMPSLSHLQTETADSAMTPSSRLLIDLSSNKNQDFSHYSSVRTDAKDSTPQVRSLRPPTSPYQDLFFKDKTILSTPKTLNSPRSESKDTINRSSYRMEVAKNYTDTKYIRRPQQIPPNNHHNTSKESFENRLENHKPRYDENKLEAIVSRIKERNSVSPAPKQRSSVTLQDANTPLGASSAVPKNFWSTTKKNEDIHIDRREVRTEEKAPIPINWQQISHIATEIEEIPNEKDVNITGNTTILELFDKKGSTNSPKFNDDPPEDENAPRTPARCSKIVAGERKLKIVVPKAAPASSENPNGVAKTTIFLQDILKDLKIDKPLRIKETNDMKERAGSVQRSEPVYEKIRNTVHTGQNFELREKSINMTSNGQQGYRGSVKISREEEGIKKRDAEIFRQSLEVRSGAWQQMGTNQKSVDVGRSTSHERRSSKDIFQLKKEVERGRTLMLEKQSENLPEQLVRNSVKEQSPPKKTEDDSLLLDDSVFSVKEGGVNTHRKINVHNSQQSKENLQNRNILDNTVIRNRFLEEEEDISDFDFTGNRFDTVDFERSKGSVESFIKFEDNYLENLGVKRQKFSEGRSQTFGLNERILPKVEAPKSGVMNRAK